MARRITIRFARASALALLASFALGMTSASADTRGVASTANALINLFTQPEQDAPKPAPKPPERRKPAAHVAARPKARVAPPVVARVAPKPVVHVAPPVIAHVAPKPVVHVAPPVVAHVAPKPANHPASVHHQSAMLATVQGLPTTAASKRAQKMKPRYKPMHITAAILNTPQKAMALAEAADRKRKRARRLAARIRSHSKAAAPASHGGAIPDDYCEIPSGCPQPAAEPAITY